MCKVTERGCEKRYSDWVGRPFFEKKYPEISVSWGERKNLQ
jgi:hypothetical protein